MRLQIVVPQETVVDASGVLRLQVETRSGHSCLLPRHADYVTVLVPGLLSYSTEVADFHLAVDDAVLVKRGGLVRIAAQRATGGTSLECLAEQVRQMLGGSDEQERKTRVALARLEARLTRGFWQLDLGAS